MTYANIRRRTIPGISLVGMYRHEQRCGSLAWGGHKDGRPMYVILNVPRRDGGYV